MMSGARIKGAFMRYFYYTTKIDHLCELFYWPAIDILLWGMTSIWFQRQEGKASGLAAAILTGLVFWQLVWRSSYEITINLLQEYWNRNLVNLFSTPLKVSEWMTATMLIGSFKILLNLLFSSLLVYLLYALNIFHLGWAFLPYIASLAMFGWFIGFLTSAFMIYFGQRIQVLAWMAPYVFAPFSAVFYPVSILPTWAQKVAYCLPTTYIFEGMRQILQTGLFSMRMLLTSLLLNVLFLALAMAFFKWMFEQSREKGLARLE